MARLARQKPESLRLVHQHVLGEIGSSHTALVELSDDTVALMDDHARHEVANLVERQSVGGARGMTDGVAGLALRAGSSCAHDSDLEDSEARPLFHSEGECARLR
jgi:hypothetical protein